MSDDGSSPLDQPSEFVRKDIDTVRPLTFLRNNKFVRQIVFLMGHIVGSGALFLCVLLVGWLVSVGVAAMNWIHPLHPSIAAASDNIEVGVFYLDICVSGIVIVKGAYDFITEMGDI